MKKVNIFKGQYIGAGRYLYLVAGRIPGDDDDSVALVAAEDLPTAEDVFRVHLIETSGLSEDELLRLEQKYGCETLVTISERVGEKDPGEAKTLDALRKCVASLDQLLPHLSKVPADIGLLNDALVTARPLLEGQGC